MARDNEADGTQEAEESGKHKLAKSVDKLYSRSVVAGTLVGVHLGDLSKLFFRGMFGDALGTMLGLTIAVLIFLYWEKLEHYDELLLRNAVDIEMPSSKDDSEREGGV